MLDSYTVLQQQQVDQILQPFSDLITQIALLIPRLLGALIVLVIGWIFGKIVARIVSTVVDKAEIDRLALRTPLGEMLGGSEDAVSKTFGTLAAWYVYFVAILAAANVLNIPLLSQWIADAVSYLPALLGGIVIIVIGFIVAEFVGDMIERSASTTGSVLATGVQVFLYFVVIVVALDTMHVDVGILYIFASALAGGLGLALAIGVGIAVGLGGKEYVAENNDEWAGQAGDAAGQMGTDSDAGSGSSSGSSSTGSGSDSTPDSNDD